MAKTYSNNMQHSGAANRKGSASATKGRIAGMEIVEVSRENLPLVKINFIIMAAAALMIVIGFALMAGGGTTSGEFNPEIFSTRRIVVAPTIAFLGFVLMAVGIVWRRKKAQPLDDITVQDSSDADATRIVTSAATQNGSDTDATQIVNAQNS